MKTKVIIKRCRFSYAFVWKPDGNGKYSVSILIAKDDPQVEEIKEAIKAAAAEGVSKLGDNFRLRIEDVLHDGDQREDPAYADCYYINARSKNQPGIVEKNTTGLGGATIAITDERKFYSGCYGMASVNFFAFNADNKKKGIAAGLNNVCKTDEGDFLGGSASAESDFGDSLADEDIC